MSGSGEQVVAVVVVTHDGARWLPLVLEGLRGQTRAPDLALCVDTGSRDEGPALWEAEHGPVIRAEATTSFPAAVARGLDQLPEHVDWVWLLHDDSTPAPDALERLLEAAETHDADLLGPKLREWPSLRRLLEVGVTISGTGRRETGLERGEYDQGQHDDVRRVLAVNTAGMLVRRRALEDLGGLDEDLPIFGNDLDLGWRAAAAGFSTLVVPPAVVFHAEAAHRGVRRTRLTGRHTHLQERRAALLVLFANSRLAALPLQAVRLTLGTVLRALGFLLVRAPGEALDEVLALVLLSPRTVLAARRRRRDRMRALGRERDHRAVRRLLAPPWLPYRHGLDWVSDVLAATTNQAADVADRRRAAAAEADPASFAARRQALERQRRGEDDDDPDSVPGEETGLLVRFVTNPVAVALALAVLLLLVGARAALGPVSGGGLSPAPATTGAWWTLLAEPVHPLGLGTSVPAPAYLLPLAVLALLAPGGPAAAVSLVLVLALPVALWGAWRFLRVAGRLVLAGGLPRSVLLWGALSYALVAGASGAWGGGRLGAVVALAALPWLAHAALGFADPEPDRRRRAGWRCGALLALVSAFAPVAWLLAALLGALGLLAATRIAPGALRGRSAWGPPVLALVVPAVLLAPWWVLAVRHGAAEALLLPTGRLPGPVPTGLDLLAGRLGEVGAPAWAGLLVPALALLALLPRATRVTVLVCWLVALPLAVATLLLSLVTLELGATVSAPDLSVPLAALHGAWLTAAAIGGAGALTADRARLGRAVVAAGVAVAAVATLVPLVGLGWFVRGEERLTGAEPTGVPAYMVQESERDGSRGVLVLRGDVRDGLTATVRRGEGVTVGEDEVLALAAPDTAFLADVRSLVSDPTSGAVERLAAEGVRYVVQPAPADGEVAAVLDATSGLTQASADDRGSRAWELPALEETSVQGGASAARVALLVLQGLAVVAVLVQCAPTRGGRRAAGAER